MPPDRYRLRIPEPNAPVFFLNDGLEHVIDLAVEHNRRRAGGRVLLDLVRLFFAGADLPGGHEAAAVGLHCS
jgi:hypothetical protein